MTAGPVRAAMGISAIMLGSGLMALIYTIPAPLLFQIGKEYGPWIAQGMGNLPSLGIIAAGLLSGMLARRLGLRSVLLMSLGAYCVLGPLGAIVRNPYLLLASRFGLGFSAALAVSTTIAFLSFRYAESSRPRMIGIAGGIAGFIGLVSLLLSGQIASQFTWRASFWMYLFAAPVFALAFFGISRDVPAQTLPNGPGIEPQSLLRAHWRLLIAVTLLFCASFSTGLQLSFKLGEQGILSPTAQSYVILGASLFNALGSFLYGFVVARIGDFRVRCLLLALMSVGALIIGGGTTALVIGLGGSLMGLGSGMVGPNLLSKALLRVAASERSAATGIFYSCIFVGEFLNPLVMQPLRGWIGTDGAFLILGVALSLATLTVLARRRAVAP